MSDLIYQLKDLRVSFPDLSQKPLLGAAPRTEVLKGLTFDISKGDILGIVGGSGSGKSTLGRAMIRLIEPDAGSILFEGTQIAHMNEDALRPLRKRFQMIFQDPMSSLNPRRRVGGIIAGPLRLQGFDNIRERVGEALEMVGLPRSFDTRCRWPPDSSCG